MTQRNGSDMPSKDAFNHKGSILKISSNNIDYNSSNFVLGTQVTNEDNFDYPGIKRSEEQLEELLMSDERK